MRIQRLLLWRAVVAVLTLISSSSATAAGATAGTIELVSRPYTNIAHSFGDSSGIELSADGRWAMFTSNGRITVDDDDQARLDVFLRDLATGDTILVSQNAANQAGDGNSLGTALSSDGRFVLFESDARNLIPGDTNGVNDVFLFDRATTNLTLVSRTAGGGPLSGASRAVSMTENGRFVLFETDSPDLATNDVNASPDLFLFDRESGKVQLVTADGSNTGTAGWAVAGGVPGTFYASASEDGKFVVFISSATNIVSATIPNIMKQPSHVYLRDMAAGTNIWLSRTATNNAIPLAPAISRDGRRVAFTGPDAPPGTARSLYIYDTATGTFQTVKHPVSATYDPSLEEVAISADGEHVAWISEGQLYLYDVASQTESLISTAPDGTPANSEVSDISISDNGSVVLFTSTATNLSPGTSGDASELYRWDRTAGNVALLSTSVSGGGSESDVIFPVLSGDGSTAGFMSFASDLVPGDDYTVNDVYVVGTSGTNTVRLVSAPGGVPPSSTASGGSAVPPQAVSANGRIVVFASTAPDLVPNDNNFESDVFAYDVQSRTIRLISTAPDGVHSVPGGASFALLSPGPMGGGVVSDDGNVVVFSALAPGATNAAQRAYYAADLRLGTNRVASVLPDGSLAPGLYGGVLSGDGRYFAFETNIGFNSPLFVRDLEEQRTAVYPPVGPDQLSISTHGEYIGVQNATRFLDRMKSNYFTLPAGARVVSLPLDGKVLRAGQRTLELYNLAENTFRLISTNYADSIVFSRNGKFAVYLQRPVSSQLFFPYLLDLSTAESRLLFENADTNITFRYSAPSSVSDDGRYVAFISTNGIAGTEASTNSFGYLYRFDRAETNVTLISRSITGALPLYPSSRASMSADGSVIVFHSGSPDIVPGDRNRASDVFVYRASVASGDQNRNGIDDAWEVAHFGQANVDPQADADGDGATNLQEYLAGTDPRDAQSALRLSMHASSGATLEWFGVAGKRYQVQFRASLSEGAWQNLGNPVTGQGRIVQLPANGGEAAAGFYRVVLVE